MIMTKSNAKPPAQADSPDTIAATVQLRNRFYVDGYRATQAVMVLLGVALVGSVWLNFRQASRPAPPPAYFSVDGFGRITPVVPLSDPLLNTSQLANWVSESLAQAYTLDAKNYAAQVEGNRTKFTSDGFEQYKSALIESGTIDLIKRKILIASATVTSAPIIVDTMRAPDGTLFWKMQAPMLVTYTSAKEQLTENLMVNLVVTRVPTTERPSGVAINQFVSRRR